MTKDKTVTMSRELAENIANYMEGSASGTVRIWHNQVRALLADPAEVPAPCECGSTDVSIGYESPQGYWIECGDCGHATEKSHCRESILSAWQKRAAPIVEADGMGEAVEAILLSDCVELSSQEYGQGCFATHDCVRMLFASQPAPVSVDLSKVRDALNAARAAHGTMLMSNPPQDMWIVTGVDRKIAEALACLDKVKELNQ